MTNPESDRSFTLMATALLAIALVLPFAYRIDLGPGPDSIRAIIWDYIESSWYSGFRIWNPLDTLPYTLLRLIFAILLAGLYAGKTSPKRTLLVGILAEIQPVLVSAPFVFLIDWSGDPWVPLYIPIPIMLVLGVVLLLWFRYKQA